MPPTFDPPPLGVSEETNPRVSLSIWTVLQIVLWIGNLGFITGVLYTKQLSHDDRIKTLEERQDANRLAVESLRSTQPEQDRRLTTLENSLLVHQAEDLKRSLK